MKRVIVEKLDSAKLIKSCAVSVMLSASLCLGCLPTAAQVKSRWRTAHNFQPQPRSRAAQQPSAPAAEQTAAQKYFTDIVLVNQDDIGEDRKSTRLNSSHDQISYAVFCLKKK